MSIQDTDNFIVGRGESAFKITYETLKENITPPITGAIFQPIILAPSNGSGIGGDVTYTPKTSEITNVQGGTFTLQNSNSYDVDTGEDRGQPISETFLAGDTVYGIPVGETLWGTPSNLTYSAGVNPPETITDAVARTFDGNPLTSAYSTPNVDDSTVTWNCSEFNNMTGRLRVAANNQYANVEITIVDDNGLQTIDVSQASTIGNDQYNISIGWYSFGNVSNLRSITISQDTTPENGKSINAVELNGTILRNPVVATGTLTSNASGNTINVTNETGVWVEGMEVINDNEVTKTGPGADVLEFVGSIPGGAGINAWGEAQWEISDDNFVTSMTDTKAITDASVTQTLAVGERNNINLAADTTYQARLRYTSTDPELVSANSNVVNFKTASTTRELFPASYYDTEAQEPISGDDLSLRYGIDPETDDLSQLGIAELTEQPDYPVLAYVLKGDKYRPLRDYSPEMNELAEARSRLASLEADEINDDATDSALLTLIANLTQRVTDLEQSN